MSVCKEVRGDWATGGASPYRLKFVLTGTPSASGDETRIAGLY